MQAISYCFVQPLLPSKFGLISTPLKLTSFSNNNRGYNYNLKVKAAEPLSINYNSPFSVFPAEACDTVGGEACSADMYPEVKPSGKSQENSNGNNKVTVEQVERDYFDYQTESKSVLMGEACDDLGGEFCEAPYTTGVF